MALIIIIIIISYHPWLFTQEYTSRPTCIILTFNKQLEIPGKIGEFNVNWTVTTLSIESAALSFLQPYVQTKTKLISTDVCTQSMHL